MLTALGVGGSFVHVILHADGPVLLPRPDLLDPLLVEFFYLVIAFVVAAFVGVMARRDHCPGYGEIADATPAPLGSRVAGRALAAAAVTVVFALTPTVSVWIVNALVVPDAFSLLDPVLHFGLVLAPSMLELCALVLLAHALVRHTAGRTRPGSSARSSSWSITRWASPPIRRSRSPCRRASRCRSSPGGRRGWATS